MVMKVISFSTTKKKTYLLTHFRGAFAENNNIMFLAKGWAEIGAGNMVTL